MGTISSVYSVPTVNKDSQNETESTSQDHPEKVMDSGENSQHSEEGHSNQTNKQSHTVLVAIEEIFGETNEQKIIRLEKLLGKERQEKWEMIEKSERTRVDLVNKAKELQQLKNELENSKRQAKELELALKRLKREESSQAQGEEDKEDEEDDQDSEKSTKLKKELERFRADLSEKREARRKALNSISTEMNRLREELENEKQVRRKLERDIRLQEKTDMMSDQESASDLSIICAKKENETLKKEVDILTDDIDKLKELRTENKSLKLEIKQLSHEVTSLNTLIFQLKNDYKEEKRKLEKTNKEKVEIEKEKDRNVKMRKDLENEKEKMWEEYDKEKEEINKRTSALKEVIEISRQMLAIRESQVQELKTKLKEIEESVAHSKILEEEGLRVEYEKQLENIKTLKELYEERVRLMEMEREKLKETITQHLKTIQDQKGEIDDLKEQCGNTSEELEKEKLENQSLEKSLKMSIAKSKDFENELTLMNNMFTQMLLGPFNSGSDTDLDKLTEFLQENHQLITELTTKEESSEIASAFPKLLLDLLTQAEGSENADPNWKSSSMLESTDTISEQSESVLEEHQGAVLPVLSYKNATVFRDPTAGQNEQQPVKPSESIDPAVQEIASNLPKVWKVLTELLSIHSAAEGPTPGDEKQCYKNIETPYGTKSVISVSNTFIRLKDLILEKKSLQKELGRLKQLNSHLEIRLDDQEKRLSQVQCELHKTWGIVGKMRAQHQQLHNHEKILRYELQEKRIMLSELKQELEYCRDKWERARQKNAESETEWKKLRKEFAARKIKNDVNSNLNDSAESGFSDEPNDSGEEAESFDADRSSTQSPVDKNLLSEGGTSKGAVPKARDGVKPSDKSKSRAIRLKRLEDQCQLLVRQVDITAHKSNYLSDRLEQLHEHHASSEEIHRPIVLKKESESADLPQSNQTEGASASAQLSETPTTLETLPPDIKQERPKGSRTEKSQGSEVLRIDRSIENPPKEADIESDARMAGNEKKAQVTSDINSETTQEHLLRLEPEALSRQVEKMDGEGANLAGSSPDQKTIRNESSESREERLRRLENEGRSLLSNVISTVEKSENLSNKLDEMHARVLRRELLRENSDEKTDSEKPINDENKPEDNVEESASALALTEETSSKGAIPRTEAKEQRLKRLEEECQNFMKKATDTVQKSIQLSNKLDDIHDTYVNYEVSKMTFPQENKDESNNSQEKSGDDSEKTHG